jgi:hypothetical protein
MIKKKKTLQAKVEETFQTDFSILPNIEKMSDK